MEPIAKIIIGAIYHQDQLFDLIKAELQESGFDIQRESEVHAFDQTDYYEPEMGSGLKRCFISLAGFQSQENIADWKPRMMELESRFAENTKRLINLDPGYLDLRKVVLLSGKEGPQKIYLKNGVWADMVLMKKKGGYQEMSWTFPDLRQSRYDDFFLQVRADLKSEIKKTAPHE